MGAFRIEISVSAPRGRVWKAWTEAERVARWFSPEANVEAREGGPFELFFDPSDHDHQSTKGCVFTAVEPEKRLAFTWKGPDQFAELMNHTERLTSVVVNFCGGKGVTRISVEHDGWGEGEDWELAKEWHMKAWDGVLQSLKSHLESS